MNVRVEYEQIPIKNIAVQCPKCNTWLNGWEAMKGTAFCNLRYKHDIYTKAFKCPLCGEPFGQTDDIHIEEVDSSDECYKDCVENVRVW